MVPLFVTIAWYNKSYTIIAVCKEESQNENY